MVPGTHVAHDIEVTTESLQAELERLQIQKQSLERELAAVVAHLASVQRTLSTLETLMPPPSGEAAPAGPAAGTAAAERDEAAVPGTRRSRPASPEPADTPTPAGADTDGPKQYGRLTEQIMEYFAAVGDADVRARDVAAALGRDCDSGSINGVRSTLDRLVGASRIRRTGRGLYRAKS